MIRKLAAAALPALVAIPLLAAPASAAPAVDVPATFSLLRTSTSTVVVSTRVLSHSPSTTTTRVMVHRAGRELYNRPGTKGDLRVARTLTVKVGDYVTVTAVDGHGHVDREARRIVVGPMK